MTATEPDRTVELAGQATPMGVRRLLARLRAHLAALGAGDALTGQIELALAEALNNIAEHAYADAGGPVRLRLPPPGARLVFELYDKGAPLPGLTLPDGRRPDATVPRADLPEGGFGWFLIRDLTESLHYTRRHGENRLTLEFVNNPDG